MIIYRGQPAVSAWVLREKSHSIRRPRELMLRLHGDIFIAHFPRRRKFASLNEHFLTLFPRRDVSVNARRKKMCGAFTHTHRNKTCRIDAKKCVVKCASVNEDKWYPWSTFSEQLHLAALGHARHGPQLLTPSCVILAQFTRDSKVIVFRHLTNVGVKI